jgi:CBS domain-containing membrane protein
LLNHHEFCKKYAAIIMLQNSGTEIAPLSFLWGFEESHLVATDTSTIRGVRMKVRDLMQTDVVTLRMTDTLEVADTFMRQGLIRHLPIVDADNQLVGLVAQADLLKASASPVLSSTHTSEEGWLGTVAVRDVMITDVTTITPDAEIVEAVDLLAAGRLGCLPVVKNSRLVGILTETDCLRYLSDLLKTTSEHSAVGNEPSAMNLRNEEEAQ